MSSLEPKLRLNKLEKMKRQMLVTRDIMVDVVCIIGQLFLFTLKLMYYWSKTIYYKINPSTPVSVKGEIVLITGTGHGIGRELALAYSSNGATVVGLDINKKNNDETIQHITKLRGRPRAYSFQCDVRNREEVLRVADEIKSTVGKVTILINNAGIMPCHPLNQHSPQEIEKIFSVNVIAHFWLLEAFLPAMKENNHGHIVSLSSMAGIVGFPNLIPYCASKFAVRGYMEALHEELRLSNPDNKIKLTCIYPYMVDTGLCKRPKIKYKNLMPLLPPKDVAEQIFHAQTHRKLEATIPGYLGGLVQWGRLLPYNAAMALKDSFETLVESDM